MSSQDTNIKELETFGVESNLSDYIWYNDGIIKLKKHGMKSKKKPQVNNGAIKNKESISIIHMAEAKGRVAKKSKKLSKQLAHLFNFKI